MADTHRLERLSSIAAPRRHEQEERMRPAAASLLSLARSSPRLPRRAQAASGATALSALAHAAIAFLFVLTAAWRPDNPAVQGAANERRPLPLPRLIFLQMPGPSSGGGGGGNRQPAPPSRRATIGRDRLSVPVRAPAPLTDTPPEITQDPQALVLSARPLDAGTALLTGLPDAESSNPWSHGPGSGGGVGDGVGTGIGSGSGPGIGPGSGGGFGGGAYRPGGGVVAPTLLRQVLPKYTAEALARKVQGTVVLDVVVGRDGIPAAIRVARSLDPGLDAEAVAAVREWRFVPGRQGSTPVDVLVTILVDFRVV